MTFSKEDNAAWLASEVMQQLEKLAKDDGIDASQEAYEPIASDEDDASTWEDEDNAEKLEKVVDELQLAKSPQEQDKTQDDDAEKIEKVLESHKKNLFDNIEKISYELIDKSNIKAAYKVECALQSIKVLLEDK
jgi:hypothetical protein